ncbi:MAG: Lpg1974 family pore-forming outer membrane protein [Legionellaceae bacterium]|nr:Lpg1974 family pore-forming outer membrane protein [Legionellaceae bacterium]
MLAFKNRLGVVLALSLSCSTVFSGTMGAACEAKHATTLCEGTFWDFGARALYLTPAYSAGDYRYAAVDNTTGQYEDFNQNRGWGFFLEGSFHYETGSDVSLNLYHFAKSMKKDFDGDFNFFRGREVEIGVSNITPQWDALNLEFGQYVSFGENKHVRFHGGLQYARITIAENLSGSNPSGLHDNFSFNFKRKSLYNGFGGRVGIDMTYDLGHDMGVYSNFAAAILAGYDKARYAFEDNTQIPLALNASKVAIVPEVEAKLGIKYDYGMAMGDLTFDLAWMWFNYFNATQAIPSNFITRTTPPTVAGDFGYQGLYFGLHWLGNGF